MFMSSRVGAVLITVALSACAHQSDSFAASRSYPGGRAAQPGGYLPSDQRAPFERMALATRDGQSYLGGRAAQPASWVSTESPRVVSSGEAVACVPAGRDAQPFSGPSLRVVNARGDATGVACRSTPAAHRF